MPELEILILLVLHPLRIQLTKNTLCGCVCAIMSILFPDDALLCQLILHKEEDNLLPIRWEAYYNLLYSIVAKQK